MQKALFLMKCIVLVINGEKKVSISFLLHFYGTKRIWKMITKVVKSVIQGTLIKLSYTPTKTRIYGR